MTDSMIADIIARPDDDAPRLVYADWLLERSDPGHRERGEFIQLSCALEKLNDAAATTRAPMVRRAMELLGRSELKWVDALLHPLPRRRIARRGATDTARPVAWAWSRGFIERYRGGLSDDFRAGELEQVRKRTPLRDLWVALSGDTSTRAFLERPWLSALRRLDVEFRVLPDALRRFLETRALHGLRHLSITLHEQRQVQVLAQHMAGFRHLESFELGFPDGRIEPGTFDAIAALPFAPRLKHFGWRQASGLDQLVQLPFLLESLAVRGEGAGDVVRRLGARPRAFPLLHALEVTGSFSFHELDELVRSRGGFRSLRLSRPAPGPGFEQLISRTELETLQCFSLSSAVPFGDQEVEALASATHLKGLRELELTHQQITNEGAKALIAAPHLQRLRRLSLQGNDRIGASVFVGATGLDELEQLDLRDNSIPGRAAAADRLRKRFGAAVRVAYDPP